MPREQARPAGTPLGKRLPKISRSHSLLRISVPAIDEPGRLTKFCWSNRVSARTPRTPASVPSARAPSSKQKRRNGSGLARATPPAAPSADRRAKRNCRDFRFPAARRSKSPPMPITSKCAHPAGPACASIGIPAASRFSLKRYSALLELHSAVLKPGRRLAGQISHSRSRISIESRRVFHFAPCSCRTCRESTLPDSARIAALRIKSARTDARRSYNGAEFQKSFAIGAVISLLRAAGTATELRMVAWRKPSGISPPTPQSPQSLPSRSCSSRSSPASLR